MQKIVSDNVLICRLYEEPNELDAPEVSQEAPRPQQQRTRRKNGSGKLGAAARMAALAVMEP